MLFINYKMYLFDLYTIVILHVDIVPDWLHPLNKAVQ